MHTTKASQEGVTFHHNGDPTHGPLKLVVELSQVEVEMDELFGKQFVTVNLEYDAIRDFVLHNLAKREISMLEQMSGDELAAYYTGDWAKLSRD